MALKALIRVRLLGLKGTLTGANRSRKQRTRAQLIGFAVLMLYTFGYFTVMLYGTFSALAGPLSGLGLGVIYFAFAAVMSFSLMVIGSVFTAKAQLFEATDNDLLLSMPIRPDHILLSRMLLLLLMNLLFDLIVAAPAIVAWFRTVGVRVGQLLSCLLVFLVLLPALALMLTALLGWLLHLASSRVRNQSLMTVVLSLVFLGAYFYAISQANTWINSLLADPTPLADAIGAVAPLVWIGRACADTDPAALGGLTLGTAAVFLLGWMALSRSFIRTATEKRGAKKVRYVERAVDAVPPARALLRREFRHLFASPSYLLNCGLGLLMTPIAAVFLLIRRNMLAALTTEHPIMEQMLPVLLLFGLCFLAATSILTAPSVSLEGRSLWLLQSLPVSPREVLAAKLKMHLLLCLPAMFIAAAVCVAVLRPEPLLAVCYFAVPAACSLFSGLLGLFENLRHPNLDWINETQAVKTGMSVMFTMFIGWGVLLPPMVLFFIFGDLVPPAVFALATLALFALLSALLWRWLRTRGEKVFYEL